MSVDGVLAQGMEGGPMPELEMLAGAVGELLRDARIPHGLRRALSAVGREIDVCSAHLAGCEDLPSDFTARRVQVGGGSRLLPGFVNIDIKPPADLILDVREGFPLPDGDTELVFAEHFLEHIDYPVSVKRFVAECFRILKPGGQLVIGVPDARMAIEGHLAGDAGVHERLMRDWYGNRDDGVQVNTYLDLVNYVFRDQDDSDRYTPHLWAYDRERLMFLCSEAGFRRVEPWPHDPSIANPEREWGSVYTVATK